MDRENKPDREGYLGFREAVDDFGNKALAQRAVNEWWYDGPASSDLAQYYDLFLAERAMNKHYIPSEHEQVAAAASKGLPEIRNTDLRKQVATRIERLSNGWHSAKTSALLLYNELMPIYLKSFVAHRQHQHPHETDGQAWFEVKRDLDHQQLDYLDQLKARYERAVDKQVSRALGSEAKVRAATALDLARQFTAARHGRSASLAKDQDRER